MRRPTTHKSVKREIVCVWRVERRYEKTFVNKSFPEPFQKTLTGDMKPWFFYLIRTRLNSLYAGVSTDVTRRFQEHCAGGKKTAKYLRSKMPLNLVYQVRIGSHRQALQVEFRFRKLSKQKKENLVIAKPRVHQLLKILKIE